MGNFWKIAFILICLIVLCSCEKNIIKKKLKHRKHHNHLLYIGLVYFLLLKAKIVIIFGTVFTIMLAVGKFYGLFKLAEYLNKAKEPEKIYIPTHDDHHHDFSSFSNPSSSPFGTPYSSDISVDKLPPNAVIAGSSGQHSYSSGQDLYGPPGGAGGQEYDSPPGGAGGHEYDSAPPGGSQYGSYGRSNQEMGFMDNIQLIMNMIPKMDITKTVFSYMNIKSDECRRKFVCQADYSAKYNVILRTGLKYLRDDGYAAYRGKKTAESLEECDDLYPNCEEVMN